MNNRLFEFIRYKTGGKQAEFAELMGWSPQYLNKLLKDGSIGIRPIISLLEKFTELNARWLLLGEGAMITTGVDCVKQHLLRLLQIEKYMPVMTPEELRQLQDGRSEFDDATIEHWAHLLDERNRIIQRRFEEAYNRQKKLCNQNEVK
jgi:transcriptional regulator with XRE-family HTH domain